MEYFAFQWHITEACDQRCKHCYIYALGSHAKFQEMALEDMVRVIENCQAFCRKAGRLPYFYLTGGDPILHPQFWRLAGLLKEQDLPFAILGNPFHLTDDVCQKLRDHGAGSTNSPWTASGRPTTASAAPAPTTRPWRPSPLCGRRASTWP